ncbi:MAG: Ig-like domain-containing protein [Anaerovoracaceae bacterium]
MKILSRAKKVITIMLALAMVFALMPQLPGTVEKAYAVNATSVTITAGDGTQAVVAETKSSADGTWSYNAETATLTLNNWTGQKISANGDLNLHLVGTNTINIAASSSEVIGILIGSESAMSNMKITADTGGILNIKGSALTGDFKGIEAHTEITNGTVNIDITSSGSNNGYGMWGNVIFTKNETNPAVLNVKVTDNGTKTGNLYAFYNGTITVEDRGAVTINAEAHAAGGNKYYAYAMSALYIDNASPVIAATADCKAESTTNCIAVNNLMSLGLTAGGKLTATGIVKSLRLPYNLNAHVVTTDPADNNYIFRRGKDVGKGDYYYYMCSTDGSILENVKFEYSSTAADFLWKGGTHFDIPAGQVGFNEYSTYNLHLLAGLRGADGINSDYSNTKFEITSGSLPSGLEMNQKGVIYGTVDAPCSAGSIEFKATDTTNPERTVTFTINYGAFVEPDKYLTVGIGTGSEKKVEMKTDDSGSGWTYNGTTKTLTLNGYNGGPIASEGDLNLHLVGTNTINIAASSSEVIGILIGSESAMSNMKITADTGGILNIKGSALTGDFKGIEAHTEITNGTVNIDITSSGSNNGYGMWGNVIFTKNETNPAVLNVKVTDNGTKTGNLYAFYNGTITVEDRGAVTINAEAHAAGGNKYYAYAMSALYIDNASPVIAATADCKAESTTNCIAVNNLMSLGLTAGGKLTATGIVKSLRLPYNLNAHVVTTDPADNNYIFRRGKDVGKGDYYYYMCSTDGSILENVKFEYSSTAADFLWKGGTHFDIPAGQVGFNEYSTYNLHLLAGLRGADGINSDYSNTKFEITSGSLPSGLEMNQKGVIYGTVDAPCIEGSITVKATDTKDPTRTETFEIHYGAFTSQKPVTDMTLDKTEIILEKYATETITATVTPADASYPNVKASSSDSNIARIESVGEPSGASSTIQVSTGYNAGKATITVTSIDSSLNKTCDVYVRESEPNASVNYYNDTLNGLSPGRTYSVSGTGVTTINFTTDADKTNYPLAEDWLGKEISLVLKNGTYENCDSSPQTITLPARPEAPTGIGTVGVTIGGGSDGKLTGVNSNMQYRKFGETSWTDISGSTVENLSEGTYEVRTKSTSTVLASKPATVTIGEKATYSVIFGKGEGGGTMTSDSCLETLEYTLPTTCDFIPPTGKVFTGWQIGSTVYNPGDKFIMPSSDVTVTAVYTPAPTNLTFSGGITKAEASWTAPAGAEGNVSKYRIYLYKEGTEGCILGFETEDASTYYEIGCSTFNSNNLEGTFTFRVEALKADGSLYGVTSGMSSGTSGKYVYTKTWAASLNNIDFGIIKTGYIIRPDAKAVTFSNTGNQGLQVTYVELTEGTDKFDLSYYNTCYANVGDTDVSSGYTIRPKEGLSIGTHTAKLKMTFSGVEEAFYADVTFKVGAEVSITPGANMYVVSSVGEKLEGPAVQTVMPGDTITDIRIRADEGYSITDELLAQIIAKLSGTGLTAAHEDGSVGEIFTITGTLSASVTDNKAITLPNAVELQPAPTLSYPSGTRFVGNTLTVTIHAADAYKGAANVKLYCNTDTAPYTDGNSITLDHTYFAEQTHTVWATVNGVKTNTAKYTYKKVAAGTIGTPEVITAPGNFVGTKAVDFNDDVVGAEIYYTTDNSDPTSSTTIMLYTAGTPISLTDTTTIKACYRWGEPGAYQYGAVGEYTYTKVAGVEVKGTVVSWNNTDNAKYLLYASTTSDEDIKADIKLGSPEKALSYAVMKGGITQNSDGKRYDQTFSFVGVPTGTYKLAISKPGKYVPKIININVDSSDVALGEVKLWLYGDVDYNGTVNSTDILHTKLKIATKPSIFDEGDEVKKQERFEAANVTMIVNTDPNLSAQDILQLKLKIATKPSVFDAID